MASNKKRIEIDMSIYAPDDRDLDIDEINELFTDFIKNNDLLYGGKMTYSQE